MNTLSENSYEYEDYILSLECRVEHIIRNANNKKTVATIVPDENESYKDVLDYCIWYISTNIFFPCEVVVNDEVKYSTVDQF